ncbi:MAG: hypothetical protein MUE44_15005 [Oscillatoriaceae cyanobacterium Prado104]|nr:hypothetical protein [Oscillatoriaceae cyanobacterium Prado104]
MISLVKKEEGRRKKEEGRRKREEGRKNKIFFGSGNSRSSVKHLSFLPSRSSRLRGSFKKNLNKD